MDKLIARLRVVLTAAPTWLASAGVAFAVFIDEIAKKLPNGWQDNLVQIGGIVATAIATGIAIVRLVTMVLPHERGLLSPPKPPDPNERDRGAINGSELLTVVLIIAGILAIIFLWQRVH